MTRPLTFCAALCAALLFTPLVRAQTDLYVGSNSSGVTTNFTSGTNSFENTYVGFGFTDSNNTLNVLNPGTLLTNSGNLTVGNSGSSNSMVISNGGRVAASAGVIGSAPGASNNIVLVTGTDSLWTNIDLSVGVNGAGNSLVISNGGTVRNTTGTIGLAFGNSFSNSVLVTGANSLWLSSAGLTIGNFAHGNSLVLSDGGEVIVGTDLVISAFAGSSNNLVSISGGSLTVTNGQIDIGKAGSGTLERHRRHGDGRELARHQQHQQRDHLQRRHHHLRGHHGE